MAISRALIAQAIESFSEAEGLSMNPESLVEDVVLLAWAFPDEENFTAACSSTRRAISDITSKRVMAGSLKHSLEGWMSYHYRHRVAQGARADCRIVFRETDTGIEVMGFGHRRIPKDFYARMEAARIEQRGDGAQA